MAQAGFGTLRVRSANGPPITCSRPPSASGGSVSIPASSDHQGSVAMRRRIPPSNTPTYMLRRSLLVPTFALSLAIVAMVACHDSQTEPTGGAAQRSVAASTDLLATIDALITSSF